MKRIFMLLAPLALMLVAAMALSGVAQAAPVGSKADAQCLTLAIQTLGPGFNPSNYAFHGGTAGNDNFTGQGTEGKGDVFCGFGGDDSIDTLGGGDIFIGGTGNDSVTYNAPGSTFNGGDGIDSVVTNNGGTLVDVP